MVPRQFHRDSGFPVYRSTVCVPPCSSTLVGSRTGNVRSPMCSWHGVTICPGTTPIDKEVCAAMTTMMPRARCLSLVLPHESFSQEYRWLWDSGTPTGAIRPRLTSTAFRPGSAVLLRLSSKEVARNPVADSIESSCLLQLRNTEMLFT